MEDFLEFVDTYTVLAIVSLNLTTRPVLVLWMGFRFQEDRVTNICGVAGVDFVALFECGY